MPKWLVVWIAATLTIVWVVGGMVTMSYLVRVGEKPFTLADRDWLANNAPDGHYVSDSEYTHCEGGVWVHYDSKHRQYTLPGEDNCWR